LLCLWVRDRGPQHCTLDKMRVERGNRRTREDISVEGHCHGKEKAEEECAALGVQNEANAENEEDDRALPASETRSADEELSAGFVTHAAGEGLFVANILERDPDHVGPK